MVINRLSVLVSGFGVVSAPGPYNISGGSGMFRGRRFMTMADTPVGAGGRGGAAGALRHQHAAKARAAVAAGESAITHPSPLHVLKDTCDHSRD